MFLSQPEVSMQAWIGTLISICRTGRAVQRSGRTGMGDFLAFQAGRKSRKEGTESQKATRL